MVMTTGRALGSRFRLSARFHDRHGSCSASCLERSDTTMETILIIVLLLFLFGGGGYYWNSRRG
jgi:hypothetical protein